MVAGIGPGLGASLCRTLCAAGFNAVGLAREHGELGIHVAHVLVDGMIWGKQAAERFGASEDQCLNPDAMAATYLHLIDQDRSAWSQEIDLRPHAEKF